MTPTPKVGDTVWLFDENHRVYRDGQSAPVHRGFFEERTIVGETVQSWLLNGDLKINKKTLRLRKPNASGWYGLHAKVFYSQQEVDDSCWLADHRREVYDMIMRCDDASLLRKIHTLLS